MLKTTTLLCLSLFVLILIPDASSFLIPKSEYRSGWLRSAQTYKSNETDEYLFEETSGLSLGPQLTPILLQKCEPPLNQEIQMLLNAENCCLDWKTDPKASKQIIDPSRIFVPERRIYAVILDSPTLHNGFGSREVIHDIWGYHDRSLINYLNANSRGKQGFSRQHHLQRFTVNFDWSVCEPTQWYIHVYTLLVAIGVRLNHFHHLIIYMPERVNSCEFAGRAFLGPSRSLLPLWIKVHGPGILVHELLHNLGLHHSSLDLNHDFLQDEGLNGEYGDLASVMGYSSSRLPQISTPHLYLLGWIDESETLTLVESDDSKTLYRISSSSGLGRSDDPFLIRHQRDDHIYYLSYRTTGGYDRYLPDAYRYRLQLHYQKYNSAQTWLIASLGHHQEYDSVWHLQVDSVSEQKAMILLNIGNYTSGDSSLQYSWVLGIIFTIVSLHLVKN